MDNEKPQFFIVFRDIQPLLHKDYRSGKIGALFWRTFLYLATRMSSNNNVRVTISELVKELGDSDRAIKNVMKELRDSNMITSTRKRSEYKVNPCFVMKQKIEAQGKLMAIYKEQARISKEMSHRKTNEKFEKISEKLDLVLANQEKMQKQIQNIFETDELTESEKQERVLRLVNGK